ncbi:ANF_receptor domain-containing protein [Trichonephila clavipes]|nr:ANF_receptor domain-containing protein [Trichonephila clavipes]
MHSNKAVHFPRLSDEDKLEIPEGSELANKVANDAKIVAKMMPTWLYLEDFAKFSFNHHYNITYADTHPMYTKDNYPNFFRAVPSETAFNPARVALLKYYNWTRVGTLYQNSPRYDLPHSKLLTDLDSARIAIAETQGLVEELQHELLKLKVS